MKTGRQARNQTLDGQEAERQLNFGGGELLGEFEPQYRRYASWERQEERDASDMLSFYVLG